MVAEGWETKLLLNLVRFWSDRRSKREKEERMGERSGSKGSDSKSTDYRWRDAQIWLADHQENKWTNTKHKAHVKFTDIHAHVYKSTSKAEKSSRDLPSAVSWWEALRTWTQLPPSSNSRNKGKKPFAIHMDAKLMEPPEAVGERRRRILTTKFCVEITNGSRMGTKSLCVCIGWLVDKRKKVPEMGRWRAGTSLRWMKKT